jgi:hypothetical protein
MGNQMNDGSIVHSDGVREEFGTAKNHGLYLVPVGASGSMAEELWKEVAGSLDTFFPQNAEAVAPFVKKIGEPTADPTELLQPILELVSLLAKE